MRRPDAAGAACFTEVAPAAASSSPSFIDELAVRQTGRATGPHLHWGMNWLDVRLDPAFWVPPQQAQN